MIKDSMMISELKKGYVFDYIVRYKESNDGLSPTYRDIKTAVALPSVCYVRSYLEELERDGKIILERTHKKRSIRVVGGRWVGPDSDDRSERSRL